jgi:hypothetical protein
VRSKPLLRPLGHCLVAGVVGLIAVVALVQVLDASARIEAWDTAASPNSRQASPSRLRDTAQDPGRPAPHLGYGLNVRDPANIDSLFAPLGFEWIKLYEQYNALPEERLPYKVLYRIQLNGPPVDLATWGDHVATIAQAGRGLVEAYEIGNEPNQSWQWGHQVPDPDEYVTALEVAYTRIKAADPNAIVVSGGLGPVGRIQATPNGQGWPGNNGQSMDEWDFAAVMFSQCLTGCFDAFGYHPFGFAYPPETPADSVENHFSFRGAERLRQIMIDHGLGDKPMWATEFSWIRDPDADGFGWCKLVREFNDFFGWMLVSELQQADYVSRSFAYADAHWPWMEAMFVWNLDWNDQGWVCDNIRFFSLRHVAGDPAPAYETLASMDKRPGPVGCRLRAESPHFVYLSELTRPLPITGSVHLEGLNGCDAITWIVSVAPSSTLQPRLPITYGQLGQPVTYVVDAGATLTPGTATLLYPIGTYTALLTLTTTPSDVIGSPYTIQVTLIVASHLQRIYLPVMARGL